VSASSPTEVAGKSPIDFSGSRAGHKLDPASYLKMLFPWGELTPQCANNSAVGSHILLVKIYQFQLSVGYENILLQKDQNQEKAHSV